MGGKGWKRRYFVLHERWLSYFKDARGSTAQGYILLGDTAAGFSVQLQDFPNAPEGCCLELRTPTRVFGLQAESKDEATTWLHALTETITCLPMTLSAQLADFAQGE